MLPPTRQCLSIVLLCGVSLATAACVPSAKPATKDTIAPLALPLATSTSVIPTGVTLITAATGSAVPPNVDPTVVTTAPPSTVAAASSVATLTTSTSTGSTSTGSNSATSVPSAASDPNAHTYTVAAKDTLYGIARKCSVSAQALVDYNGWIDGLKHRIFPGTAIKVPCDVTTAPTTTASGTAGTTTSIAPVAVAPTTTTTPVATVLYTIAAGDYLAGIAAAHSTTVKAIVAVNGWPDGASHLIVVGQQIKLPVTSG